MTIVVAPQGGNPSNFDVSSPDGTTQARVTFTTADVGNGQALDGNNATNEDGGLAVHIQAEDGSDGLTGVEQRFSDEGTSFFATTPGLTFDVRDLTTGAQLGDQFQVVMLGSSGSSIVFGTDQATYFNGGQGNDFFFSGGAGADRLDGGGGNDFLEGGAGADYLDGGEGSDNLFGGAGDDTILGGAGNDAVSLNVSTDGADWVNLGAGADVVSVTDSMARTVRLTLASSAIGDGNPFGSTNTFPEDGGLAVRLQAEDATGALTGPVSRFDDEGIAFSRGDLQKFDVRDLDGASVGLFTSVALGSSGDDMLTAGSFGNAFLVGGAGNDTLDGSTSNDVLEGGDGNDILTGGAGFDHLDGGMGNDTASYAGSGGGVTVSLGTGTGSGQEAEGDTLTNIENIIGSAFVDALTGDGADNVLVGNAGADLLIGGGGADHLDGGADNDTASYAGSAAAVNVNLAAGTASGGDARGDTLTGIENLVGSAFADILTGDDANNVLTGGAGADVLDGGGGLDTASYADASAAVTVGLATGAIPGGAASGDTLKSIENLTGSAFNDKLAGDANANVIDGGAGADQMAGGTGDDTYVVDNVKDTISEGTNAGIDTVLASITQILGTNVENLTLTGTDLINGTGNALSNTIIGNATSNLLNGKSGADTLTGGTGADTFYFDTKLAANNVDTITDFVSVEDTIQLGTKVFKGLGTGFLDSTEFVLGTAADAAHAQVIYDSATGNLFYDADGTGTSKAAIQFAHVDPGTFITANDLDVV